MSTVNIGMYISSVECPNPVIILIQYISINRIVVSTVCIFFNIQLFQWSEVFLAETMVVKTLQLFLT